MLILVLYFLRKTLILDYNLQEKLDIRSRPQVQCSGKMERVAVKDLSPHAGLYVNKFTVLGDEVLQVIRLEEKRTQV